MFLGQIVLYYFRQKYFQCVSSDDNESNTAVLNNSEFLVNSAVCRTVLQTAMQKCVKFTFNNVHVYTSNRKINYSYSSPRDAHE